ncbi:hypothetical protein L211DRAFT_225518 [Terfezia boudieri ATCC MYA-4762]|uniref:Uncharacterized protein n=1 Tax=Terfezia boudieri ATCC MYA-4762 TaxID=1051890 RepID=A0A3N4LLN6_9PEZI|nr:hypothetical protein L211DRAFT_225518 [Terfezia boudieri ATCC MYA-4762]
MGRRKGGTQSEPQTQTQTPTSEPQTQTSTQAEGRPARRGRRAQNQKSQSTGEGVVESGSIKWDGDRGKLLAYKLKDEYKTKYLCGTRIAVAKQWAIDLGIGHLDPKGIKTKAAAGVMLKQYMEARDHFLKIQSILVNS